MGGRKNFAITSFASIWHLSSLKMALDEGAFSRMTMGFFPEHIAFHAKFFTKIWMIDFTNHLNSVIVRYRYTIRKSRRGDK